MRWGLAALLLGTGANADDGSTITAPQLGTHADAEQAFLGGGGCQELIRNHDDTFENGYAWVFTGVAAPDFGAFTEGFSGSYQLCEVQVYLTDIGNYAGQTMTVTIYADDGTGYPGAVMATVPDIAPGAIAAWPAVTRVDVPVNVAVSGRWHVGVWGNWPGAQAGFLVAADENGAGGLPRTRYAAGLGYPQGWDHPSLVVSWQNARSMGIQAVGESILSAPDEVSTPSRLLAPMPNPFRAGTEVRFAVPVGDDATVRVFDAAGALVRTLRGGPHAVHWDGRDKAGLDVASGVYFVQLTSGSTVETQRVTRIDR